MNFLELGTRNSMALVATLFNGVKNNLDKATLMLMALAGVSCQSTTSKIAE